MIKNFPNPKGDQNPFSGSKVGGFVLLVELHQEGSAPAACAAGLFQIVNNSLQYKLITP